MLAAGRVVSIFLNSKWPKLSHNVNDCINVSTWLVCVVIAVSSLFKSKRNCFNCRQANCDMSLARGVYLQSLNSQSQRHTKCLRGAVFTADTLQTYANCDMSLVCSWSIVQAERTKECRHMTQTGHNFFRKMGQRWLQMNPSNPLGQSENKGV